LTVRFILEGDQRSDLQRLVRSVSTKDWRATSEALYKGVEASISAWLDSKDLWVTAQGRAQLSDLVALLTSVHRPQIGLIRARVANLPAGVVHEIEARVKQLVIKDERFRPLRAGLKVWARKANANELVELLTGCLILGGTRVMGRNRANGTQSAPRLLPVIVGRMTQSTHSRNPTGGRPRDDDLRLLVSFLAVDWLLSTGLQPVKGRSDATHFGALVFLVFRWIGAEAKATHALREFWKEVSRIKGTAP
jgi:hypothetical protein